MNIKSIKFNDVEKIFELNYTSIEQDNIENCSMCNLTLMKLSMLEGQTRL